MATTEQITHELQQDMAALKADLGTLMVAVKDLSVEQGREAYGKARAQAQAVQESMEHYVEARPLASICFAFGAGFAIGNLLGNRR
jgi:ElaB/YqjD/DUF883 family membrane-anchored ribosome-binding protein